MLELTKIYPLETERLLIRPFEIKDKNDMFNNWAQDKEISKYMLWESSKTIKEVENTIKYYLNCYKENSSFRQYAIELKETNEVIGSISVDINKKHHRADLAYLLSKKYWHKGYMVEALLKILEYLNSLGCVRVEADVLINNTSSQKLLEKCGFQKEGIARKKYCKNNEFIDAYVYSKIN